MEAVPLLDSMSWLALPLLARQHLRSRWSRSYMHRTLQGPRSLNCSWR
jgi:hypothetical protein